MKTIMFQGDSITDGGRYKDQPTHLGAGYPCLVSSKLGRAYPEQYNFVNRAISGNKVTDLIGRWKRDCLNMKPDYLTILVGVNDVWHELVYHDGTDTGTFKKVYDILLENTRKALPETRSSSWSPMCWRTPWRNPSGRSLKTTWPPSGRRCGSWLRNTGWRPSPSRTFSTRR